MRGNILIPSWIIPSPTYYEWEYPLRHSNPRPVHGRTNELNDFGTVKCLYVIVYAFCWPTQQYYMAARGYEFYLLVLKVLSSRLLQHEKIKVVSPSGHVMFCLFHRYWWNSYIKHNFFFSANLPECSSSSEKVSMWKFGSSSRKSPVTVPSSHLEAILWMKFQKNRPRAWAGSSLVIG